MFLCRTSLWFTKSFFLGLVYLTPTAVESQLQQAVSSVHAVMTRHWYNLKNGYYGKSRPFFFFFLGFEKIALILWLLIPSTLLCRIYDVYILSGTPTGNSFFIFS